MDSDQKYAIVKVPKAKLNSMTDILFSLGCTEVVFVPGQPSYQPKPAVNHVAVEAKPEVLNVGSGTIGVGKADAEVMTEIPSGAKCPKIELIDTGTVTHSTSDLLSVEKGVSAVIHSVAVSAQTNSTLAQSTSTQISAETSAKYSQVDEPLGWGHSQFAFQGQSSSGEKGASHVIGNRQEDTKSQTGSVEGFRLNHLELLEDKFGIGEISHQQNPNLPLNPVFLQNGACPTSHVPQGRSAKSLNGESNFDSLPDFATNGNASKSPNYRFLGPSEGFAANTVLNSASQDDSNMDVSAALILCSMSSAKQHSLSQRPSSCPAVLKSTSLPLNLDLLTEAAIKLECRSAGQLEWEPSDASSTQLANGDGSPGNTEQPDEPSSVPGCEVASLATGASRDDCNAPSPNLVPDDSESGSEEFSVSLVQSEGGELVPLSSHIEIPQDVVSGKGTRNTGSSSPSGSPTGVSESGQNRVGTNSGVGFSTPVKVETDNSQPRSNVACPTLDEEDDSHSEDDLLCSATDLLSHMDPLSTLRYSPAHSPVQKTEQDQRGRQLSFHGRTLRRKRRFTPVVHTRRSIPLTKKPRVSLLSPKCEIPEASSQGSSTADETPLATYRKSQSLRRKTVSSFRSAPYISGSSLSAKTPTECQLCGYQVYEGNHGRANVLKYHVRTKHGPARYRCSKRGCGHEAPLSRDFKRHRSQEHGLVGPVPALCDKKDGGMVEKWNANLALCFPGSKIRFM